MSEEEGWGFDESIEENKIIHFYKKSGNFVFHSICGGSESPDRAIKWEQDFSFVGHSTHCLVCEKMIYGENGGLADYDFMKELENL